MRARRPSQTASFVALARALADRGFTSIPRFSDPFARLLLSPGWRVLLALMARSLRRAPPVRRERTIAQMDAIPMRVSAIDAQLEAAVAAGCTQLVILGAGLDTRALRMPALASVEVFEVDHPSTQAYKRRKTSNLRPLSRSLHFVPVDFERSSLTERLSGAGFRSAEPTVWIWEGVVMYLTDRALRRTLEQIAAAGTTESVLLVTYHVPPSAPANGEMHVRRLMLSLWREPHIGLHTSESMHEAVRNVGFLVVSDTRPTQWAQTLGARPPIGHTANVSHLLVAKRAPVA